MKKKAWSLILVAVAILLCLANPGLALAEEPPPVEEPPLVEELAAEELRIPGTLEATGIHFELNDSEYLNITVDSSEPIALMLESIPEMVVMHLESASGAVASEITMGGFLPLTTYHKYEDDYHNHLAFTTDSEGKYAYTQDLAAPHLVFIQPSASTIYLSNTGWSESVGTWDAATKTGTLTQDVNETIQIDDDGITLDGNGHTITGSNTGCGVYVNSRTDVTIKNLNVTEFAYGISLYQSSGNTLSSNTAWNNSYGISLYQSSGNTLSSNTANSNNSDGIYLYRSGGNALSGNSMSGNKSNFYVYGLAYSDFDNDIDTSNTVDGKPVYYVKGADGQVFDSSTNAGIIYCINCSNVTISDLTLSANRYGVFLWETQNSTIENIVASNNYRGIYLQGSSSNTLTGNTASNNYYGIYLNYSSSNTLTGNNSSNNQYGIYLDQSSSNTLTGNTANSNNNCGIYLYCSGGNALSGNSMSGNRYNFSVYGSASSDFDNNIDTSNTVDGKPVYYVKGADGQVFDSSTNAGVIYCINCSNVTIKDLTPSANLYGVFLWETKNSTIENIVASNNGYGIYLNQSSSNIFNNNTVSNNVFGIGLQGSSSNTLTGNTSSNNGYGICLYQSSSNIFNNNTANSNTIYGIYLNQSSSNTFNSNTASNNHYGISLQYQSSGNTLSSNTANSNFSYGISLYQSSGNTLSSNTANSNNAYGISLEYSSSNTLTGNTASNNYHGIYLQGSSSNTLTGNTASNNLLYGIYLAHYSNDNEIYNNNFIANQVYGIYLAHYSNDNEIYNNNFIANQAQAYVYHSSGNIFNLDKPTGGNYWSNWTSPDADGDGFVDSPYVFTGGQDNLPWTRQDGWLDESLSSKVEQFFADGLIDDPDVKESLLDKLSAATKKIDQGEAEPAKNILNAFINHVRAQAGKHIAPEAAEILIADAEDAISQL